MSGNAVSDGTTGLPAVQSAHGEDAAQIETVDAPGQKELDAESEINLDDILSKAIEADEATNDSTELDGAGDSATDSKSAVERVSPDADGDGDGGEKAGKPEAHPEKGTSSDAPSGELALPDRYSAEDKAKFDSLPPEGQQIVLDRTSALNAEFTRKTQEIAEKGRQADSIIKEFEPYRDTMARAGMDAPAGARYLLSMNAMYMQDPVKYVLFVAQQSGIDLAQLVSAQTGLDEDGDPIEVDPAIATLQTQIGDLTSVIQNLSTTSETSQQHTLDAALSTFQNARVEGSPDQLAHPHFEAVREKMAHFITTDPALVRLCETDPAKAISQAYENAIWTSPELRETMIDSEKADLATETEQKRQAEVDAAKKSGRVVSSGPSAGPTQAAEVKTLDDALAIAFEGTEFAA